MHHRLNHLALLASLTAAGACGDDSSPPHESSELVVDLSKAGIDEGDGPIAIGEAGEPARFTIQLSRAPLADVTFSVRSSDDSAGLASPGELRFTTTDWHQPQSVTIAVVDDDVVAGDAPFSIHLGQLESGDPDFNGLPGRSLAFLRVEDDVAGVAVTGNSGLSTEGGGEATFELALSSEPSGDVTLTLASDDASEGFTETGSLIFTPSDWNQARTVTVVGVDDSLEDGSATYQINVAVASQDPVYGALTPLAVPMVNADDDTAGVAVGFLSGPTTELGGGASFDIVLEAEPTADVVLTLASSDETEGVLEQGSVTFTPLDWSEPRTVTVIGQDDDIDDGDVTYEIAVTEIATSDPIYAAVALPSGAAVNADDDTAGIAVSEISGPTSEDGTSATFTVALSSQPLADVTIALESSDAGEGEIDTTSITFTPEDWSATRTVTVTGVADEEIDGPDSYTVDLLAAASDDPSYDGMSGHSVDVINEDLAVCWEGDNFDDGELTGWEVLGTSVSMSATASAAAEETAFGIEVSGGSTHVGGVRTTFASCQPTYISVSMKPDGTLGGGHNYFLVGDDLIASNLGVLFVLAIDGVWKIVDGSVAHDLGAVIAGKSDHFEFYLDWTSKRVNVMVNGSLAASDISFRSAGSTEVTQLHLYNLNSDATARYDEISFVCD